MKELIYSVIIILLSFVGFYIASLIRQKLKADAPLVCPLQADCGSVIRSRFAKFLGVPLVVWGMAYYAFAGLGTIALLLVPALRTDGFAFVLVTASMIACAFSFYLTAVQAFVLKEWCSWCLGSAIVSLLIFIASIMKLGVLFPIILLEFRPIVFLAYLVGLMMAFGGAIIYTILFFKFLRDYRLSATEKQTLVSIENVIMVGLGMVVVSGFGLFIPLSALYITNPELMMALIVIVILGIETVLQKADIAPRLTELYSAEVIPGDEDHAYTRRIAYAFGSVGLVSWITLVVVTFFDFKIPFIGLFAIYVGLLIIGVVWSQISEHKIYKHSLEK